MLTAILTTVMIVALSATAQPQTQPRPVTAKTPLMTVYRSRTCGCCGKWVAHLKRAGFQVTEHVVENVETAPNRNRVPEKLRSCHTGTVGPYAIEGHVPADVIKDLLRRRPDADGIAVPGMPAGSPGMESPAPQPYTIIAWDKTGAMTTFAQR